MDPATIAAAAEMEETEFSQDTGSGNESAPGSDQIDEQHSPEDSAAEEDAKAENADDDQSPPMPVQKRRRVTRACDECRRKKIKCDGKQPCTHCSVYSYECTYDKPSNRRRNPAPQYIEALEGKLARAEALLRKYIPDVDLDDPNLHPAIQQEFKNRERLRLQAAKLKREDPPKLDQSDAQIASMIETIGQLDLDERGDWDFRGTSSGAVFLKRMKEHFGGLLGYDVQTAFLHRTFKNAGLLKFDSPQSTSYSTPSSDAYPHHIYDLPPKKRARQLCYSALTCATALFRILHLPSFFERFDDVYDKPAEDFDVEDNRFLGLVYAVMAVGCMYITADEDAENPINYKQASEEGSKYYISSRVLLQDITECRDLTSLQSLLFLIIFLQATSDLSTCYGYLGIASRAALRMGLHRHLPQANFSPLVTELRRRVFWFVRQLDIYCSALLGFPILLCDEDIDQKLPTEVDDEFISHEGIRTPPPGTPGSLLQAFNAHARLMKILMKVVKYIYPLNTGVESSSGRAASLINYRHIKEIEGDLQVWHEQLPQRWRPSPEGSVEVIRVRTLLRFAYAHVQMMLYRPFLHYISPRLSTGKAVDERYYACAAACISVSRNILHISTEIKNQALIVGPFWSVLYTEFFAVISLIFYVLENRDKQGSMEIYADANAGRELIAKMTQRSLAADRITNSLNILWEKLPEAIKNGKPLALPTRKRSAPAPGPKPGLVPLSTHTSSVSSKVHGHASRNMVRQRPPLDKNRRSASRSVFSSANYPELLAFDIPLSEPLSDASSGASASRYIRPGNQNHVVNNSSLYELDAIMFPSGDPFAYPNQPLADFGVPASTHAETNPSHISAVHGRHQADANNFYLQGLYMGDINSQLTGPIPSYLMQPNSDQSGLNMSTQLYSSVPQQSQSYHGGQSHHAQQQQQTHLHDQRMNREMDDMMAESGFNRSWDMFGGNFKPL